jgi:hypothetical protein
VKGLRFRTPQFGDVVFEFVVEGGRAKALKQRTPGGELSFPKVASSHRGRLKPDRIPYPIP